MSLILDALNRADKERNEQQQTPSLQAAPVSAAGENSTAIRWGLQLSLLILIIAGLLYILLLRDTSPPVTNTEPVAVTPTTAPPVEDKPESPALVASRPPAQPKVEQTAQQKKPTTDAVAELYRQPVKSTPEAEPQTKAPARPAPRPKPSGQDILRQIPLLVTMSARFRESVPNIEYSMHVYNEEEGSGIVNLNGSMRKIGAEIEPGLRVIAILPDSVVLDYQGTQFRLLALNSWMNFN